MTTIALISDLHNELLRDSGNAIPDIKLNREVDALVMAGDIDVQEYGVRYAIRQSRMLNIPVVYVLGNHEFYQTHDRPVMDKILDEIEGTNVHVLNSESVEIAGTLFIGATLWTDFELFGLNSKNRVLSHAAFNFNDYDNIRLVDKLFSRAFTPTTSSIWHEADKAFIQAELARDYDGKKVVVTHHAPSLQCLPVFERKDLISACYASHLDWMIEKYQPNAWLHGHIHYPNQIQVGETTIISNPSDYPQFSEIPEYYQPLVFQIT
ncbi:metallophosphoesterase [Methylophaga thiooxydans]|uniref:metallophosphoesterase n=1 Tax=Methylophaga thiooxydans TaxID=392484 RepID=UPI002354BA4A|nr:metallophosphoesterase [Methylophaga thiooxydans]